MFASVITIFILYMHTNTHKMYICNEKHMHSSSRILQIPYYIMSIKAYLMGERNK